MAIIRKGWYAVQGTVVFALKKMNDWKNEVKREIEAGSRSETPSKAASADSFRSLIPSGVLPMVKNDASRPLVKNPRLPNGRGGTRRIFHVMVVPRVVFPKVVPYDVQDDKGVRPSFPLL